MDQHIYVDQSIYVTSRQKAEDTIDIIITIQACCFHQHCLTHYFNHAMSVCVCSILVFCILFNQDPILISSAV